MKKCLPLMLLSVLTIGAGFLLKPYSGRLCICLVLGGLMGFFLVSGIALLDQAKRCPACGQRIYLNAAQTNRVRSGMIPCPRCGTLVRVDHVSPR